MAIIKTVRISDIIDRLMERDPGADLALVNRAYVYSATVHEGQVRLSGLPYLTHPLEVAAILADMNMDEGTVAAALLHDVIEDTRATPDDILEMFGPDVLHLVMGVTKLSKIQFESLEARQAENIRKMFLAMAKDIRVILIKLADRLHNMRTLQFQREDKQKKIARETLDIFAPLASRLGIYWIKKELENISFMFIDPYEYRRIANLLDMGRQERENFIEDVRKRITETMEKEGIGCDVTGRYKHIHSIAEKMRTQNLNFEEVYDIIAFRIIVEKDAECYAALGHIHSIWKPIDYKFKDYIARPKPNMYQSLHTTVVGPSGRRVEIQIRTREMNKIAKSGIAAHWSYKEGKGADPRVSRTFSWIQDIVERQKNIKDPDEFLENVRIELFPDEIFVFTPNGDIKALPKGAIPVDFAYMIHTEVGNQCSGAKVNEKMVPLKYELKTGDVVEIITRKGHQPSRDWLNSVKTAKARSRIRQWIRNQDYNRSLTLGREMCEKEFKKRRLNFVKLVKSEQMNETAAAFGFKAPDDLIANVGYGKITPLQIARKFLADLEGAKDKESLLEKIADHPEKKKKTGSGVLVKGIDDVLIRFAKCCRPVPGDRITGYITRGYGVAIHRANCVNALKINPERKINVEWEENLDEGAYPADIRIRSMDRVGLLADVAAEISKNKANIIKVNSQTREDGRVDTFFTLGIKGTRHLARLLADIKKIRHVHSVERIR
ncbi:GTP pyrophosphokinase [Candidatus Desulfarcum epimagneticum]|uniref:GTP pyrophosphokinase n=1 Tax=uncultured Desulfobacteraceae bacterium TaxID=218296 RepID=A0A484HFR6_9BACT|nr:GTP pyrophosphokinase [uncultured Desulfobacteraceae bacterium]